MRKKQRPLFFLIIATGILSTRNTGAVVPVEGGWDTEPIPSAVAEHVETTSHEQHYRPTALKTNLLFDLVGVPNLGVEWLADKKISITADAAIAYWRIDNLYTLQTVQGGLGAKYWFGSRQNRPFTGWNTGIYALFCSRYDVQWRDGYQGDGFWSAGLSTGYSARIGERMNLEFALAAGWFHTSEVRHYHRPENGHRMWQQTRHRVGRITLTKVQVNLVWLIGKNGNR